MEGTVSMNGNNSKVLLSVFVFAVFLVVTIPAARADDDSQKLFSSKCAMCHGPDGKGATAIGKADKISDFTSADVQKKSDEELATTITTGKNKMPAYGKSLKPDQIKGLVAYIRSFGKKS
jgi:cytochrome c6